MESEAARRKRLMKVIAEAKANTEKRSPQSESDKEFDKLLAKNRKKVTAKMKADAAAAKAKASGDKKPKVQTKAKAKSTAATLKGRNKQIADAVKKAKGR